jgi:hypothetical protein
VKPYGSSGAANRIHPAVTEETDELRESGVSYTRTRSPLETPQPLPSPELSALAEVELHRLRERAASLTADLQAAEAALALEHNAGMLALDRRTRLVVGVAAASLGVVALIGALAVLPGVHGTRQVLTMTEGTMALQAQEASAERALWLAEVAAANDDADRLAGALARARIAAAVPVPAKEATSALRQVQPRAPAPPRSDSGTNESKPKPECNCEPGDPLCPCLK